MESVQYVGAAIINFLVTATCSGDKMVVSRCNCTPVLLLELEGQKQTCVYLNSTSMYLASGGLNNTVNIWDLKSKWVHWSLKDHKGEAIGVAYNWNDCYIASGSLSGEIVLHSITTNTSSTPFGHGSNQPVRHVKYSLFKKSLLGSASDHGAVPSGMSTAHTVALTVHTRLQLQAPVSLLSINCCFIHRPG